MSMMILSTVEREVDVDPRSKSPEFGTEETLFWVAQKSMSLGNSGEGRTSSFRREGQRSMLGSMEVDALLSETRGICWSVSEAFPDAASSSATRITAESAGMSGWALVRHSGQVECEWNHMSMQSM